MKRETIKRGMAERLPEGAWSRTSRSPSYIESLARWTSGFDAQFLAKTSGGVCDGLDATLTLNFRSDFTASEIETANRTSEGVLCGDAEIVQESV
jgi:hypothetical protein